MIRCWSSQPVFLVPALLSLTLVAISPAVSQVVSGAPPMDRVYQGQIRLPDFVGRDRKYANFRTRIREGMSSGPDFAGHYAIVQIGCGTGCSFAFVGDVASGQVHDFPYGGEEYQQLQIFRSAKDSAVVAVWVSGGRCHRDGLTWNGASFVSTGRVELGPSEVCDRL